MLDNLGCGSSFNAATYGTKVIGPPPYLVDEARAMVSVAMPGCAAGASTTMRLALEQADPGPALMAANLAFWTRINEKTFINLSLAYCR